MSSSTSVATNLLGWMSSSTLVADEDYQFPITLVLSRDDPWNCTISLDDKPLYEVKSRQEIVKKLGHNDMLVTTDIFCATQELLASVTWQGVYSDTITWPARGLKDAKLSLWLKKSLIPFSNTATFKDVEGNTYKWDTNGLRNQYRLLADKDTVIAYFERAMPYVNLQPGYNYHPEPNPSRLHLSSRADAMRDAVVLSFLVVEKDRRRSEGSKERWADAQVLGARAAFGAIDIR